MVEDRRMGDKIFYQGATAANHGIVAAFEAVTGQAHPSCRPTTT